MELAEWDEIIAPSLQRIESYSVQLSNRAAYLRQEVRYLHSRPEWVTKAENALREARIALASALRVVVEVENEFKNKPVNR